MKRIIRIGMDVHSKMYTLCAMESIFGQQDLLLAETQVPGSANDVEDFIKALKSHYSLTEDDDILCGYEAGCLGYSLYRDLRARNIACVILAPSTMHRPQGKRIKTDRRDAYLVTQCLLHGGYKSVHVPDESDNEVKEYLRMRDDHKQAWKRIKQQISAFCLRNGFSYNGGGKWTQKHWQWLRNLPLTDFQSETLDEYLRTYLYFQERLEQLERRIEELSQQERYREDVKKLGCFLGISTYTALSLIVEISDFERFPTAMQFSSYLGLVPGEDSSSENVNRLSLTKAGNVRLRQLLIESAHCFGRGRVGAKSKALKKRQEGNSPEVIDYADRANVRLRKRYFRMIHRGKRRNVTIAAIARELACFIWGMMTNRIQARVC